jgi:protein transport protein SEC61 subunit gamma-like protein
MATAAAPAPASQHVERESLVGKAWDAQERLEGRLSNLGKGKYGRVLRMARKPTTEEYRKASVVSAIGILLLGLMGNVIFLLFTYAIDPWATKTGSPSTDPILVLVSTIFVVALGVAVFLIGKTN